MEKKKKWREKKGKNTFEKSERRKEKKEEGKKGKILKEKKK